MNDRKNCDLPQKGLWRALDQVLSITCAGNPSQKCLWGTSGAQVIDKKGEFYYRERESVFFSREEAPQARITRLACYGARLRGAL